MANCMSEDCCGERPSPVRRGELTEIIDRLIESAHENLNGAKSIKNKLCKIGDFLDPCEEGCKDHKQNDGNVIGRLEILLSLLFDCRSELVDSDKGLDKFLG